MTVSGLTVQVIRKPIKNLHLGVHPPDGRVRVAAPLNIGDDAIRMAVARKLGWIKRHQAAFKAQPRQAAREMIAGESHYVLGRRYRLRVVASEGHPTIALRGGSCLELCIRPETTAAERLAVLQRWHRALLHGLMPAMVEKWQKTLGVQVAAVGIKKMKTKWGSCNPKAQRIWVNLELAKKPVHCIEYIVAHEIAHIVVPHHDQHFAAIMDKHVPSWRSLRKELNAEPLANENWSY